MIEFIKKDTSRQCDALLFSYSSIVGAIERLKEIDTQWLESSHKDMLHKCQHDIELLYRDKYVPMIESIQQSLQSIS